MTEQAVTTEPIAPGTPPGVVALANHVPPASSTKPSATPRIIALMNQKGGVGKTTTCVNLGAGLAKQGKRVLMIDLDPQAHLTLHLGVEPGGKTIYDLLGDATTTTQEVLQSVSKHFDILPAEVNLAGIEAELADRVITGTAQNVLKTKCAALVEQYDYVLLDCPPSLGLLTINALVMAREVIVPMQGHFLALQGLGKLFETIAMVGQGINPQLRVAGVVLCMHEKQTILANEVIADLTRFIEEARGTDQPWAEAIVFDPPIRRNIKLAESPSFGQSIFDYAPDCHGAKDYARLATSVAAHCTVHPA